MKAIVRIIALATVLIFLNGCGQRPDTDVTLLPYYNFASFSGTVWKTKVELALADVRRYNGWHQTMLMPRHDSPPALQKIITVLPAGTYLRIERLMRDNGNWGGVQVTASFVDKHVNLVIESGNELYLLDTLLAKNAFFTPGWSESKEWGVDPDLLEKVD